MITIATHNGKFHADDVLSVSILQLIHGVENCTIVRTRDQSLIDAADIVVDVGGEYDPQKRRFDHHQEGGAGGRQNGIRYSSLGIVWKEYAHLLCSNQHVIDKIDSSLVAPVDAGDNGIDIYSVLIPGVSPHNMQSITSSFLPPWDDSSEEAFMRGFGEATAFGRGFIERTILQTEKKIAAEVEVRTIYEQQADEHILILGKYMPWHFLADEAPELTYVVFPESNGDHYVAMAVKVQKDSFELRKGFPDAWRGHRDQALRDVTGVSDAIFCHNNGFILSAKTKDAVLKLVHTSLNQ
jgi:uncharacterized UPF0160 family protein